MRLKPLLSTLAITGALAGGGAALASAATSSTTTPTNSAGTTTTTPYQGRSAPAQGTHAPGAPRPGGSHHCPNM